MKKRMIAYISIIIIMSIAIFSLLSINMTKNNYLNEVEKSLISEAMIINDYLKRTEKEIDLDVYAKEISILIKSRVTFIDKNGVVVGDSAIPSQEIVNMENHKYREEVSVALDSQIAGTSIRMSNTTGVDYMYVAIPTEEITGRVSATRLALPLDEIEQINRQFIYGIIIAAIFALFVTTMIGVYYSGKVTKPIVRLTRYAEEIEKGNYKERIDVKNKDEIASLGNALNSMSTQLEKSIGALVDNHAKLESIILSINEGLIAVDHHRGIMLANDIAKDLLDIERIQFGNHINRSVRHAQILDMVDRVLDTGKKQIDELHYGEDRIIKIKINAIYNEESNTVIGALAIFEEITQMKKLEKMRSDFVANVSHELKTPLTSIQGFVETLQQGAVENEETRKRFLNIIDFEAKRLKRLIEEVLSLAEIEKEEDEQNNEVFSINAALEESVELLEKDAKEKQIDIELFALEQAYLNGKQDRFKQMMINIIENAIKYSEVGKKIQVTMEAINTDVKITVKDEGIGIPQKDITRVFERFYRVDQSRSKDISGTGLGLSIVKHIVKSFSGHIIIKSVEGEGTTISITMPKG